MRMVDVITRVGAQLASDRAKSRYRGRIGHRNRTQLRKLENIRSFKARTGATPEPGLTIAQPGSPPSQARSHEFYVSTSSTTT
jgi:hypothetical protein